MRKVRLGLDTGGDGQAVGEIHFDIHNSRSDFSLLRSAGVKGISNFTGASAHRIVSGLLSNVLSL